MQLQRSYAADSSMGTPLKRMVNYSQMCKLRIYQSKQNSRR